MVAKRKLVRSIYQPQHLVAPSHYWKLRGLQFVFLGNRLIYDRDGSTSTPLTVTGGPKFTTGPFGVAQGFGSTFGTGTTDRLDNVMLSPTATGYRSIVAHVYAKGGGGGGLGRVFQPSSGNGTNSPGEAVFFFTGGVSLSYLRYASTAAGQWYTTPAHPTGRWSTFGVTHDQTTIPTTPTLYIDGASVGVTTPSAPSGSYSTSRVSHAFGNRPSDSLRNWDGLLGPILIFDSLLSSEEHLSLTKNPWQVFSSRIHRVPAGGGTSHTITVSGGITLSGTVSEIKTKIGSVSGGVTFGGSPAYIKNRVEVPSGLVQFGGSSPITFVPAGGAPTIPQRTIVGTGV